VRGLFFFFFKSKPTRTKGRSFLLAIYLKVIDLLLSYILEMSELSFQHMQFKMMLFIPTPSVMEGKTYITHKRINGNTSHTQVK